MSYILNGLLITDNNTTIDIEIDVPFRKTYTFSTTPENYKHCYTFPFPILQKYKTLYYNYKNKDYIEQLLSSIVYL